ncbi:MAG: TrbI/VirB10 family protein [Rhizomicrobium sp.]|nr:TrbI/VirB10 family protein [Rhizomicrobium sp.]
MSDQPIKPAPDAEQDRLTPAHTREMRLHPERSPVTRLSRKVLLGLGTVAAIGIAGAAFFALIPHTQKKPPELVNTTSRTAPDGLATLPRDYTGLPRNAPKLGPPLPGDLGKPILNAGAPVPGMAVPGAESSQQQRLVQEYDAARTSHLFATANTGQGASPPAPAIPTNGSAPGVPAPATPSNSELSDHKLAFLNAPTDHQTQSSDRIEAAPSPYVLQSGAIIPAALITGLRSDLPGEVTAQVTQNTYDRPTGRILLIPQGARLIGQYDAQVSFGQSRALLVWNRLILPNGRSVMLERQPGIDTEGYAGLEDEVDNHWGALFKAAVLSTVLRADPRSWDSGAIR